MKRKSILLLCALTAVGAFAQKNLVEEVDHEIGGYNSDFKAACEKIKPALTNEETKGDVKTWFVAGKANFGLYDNLLGQMQLGKADVDKSLMGTSLVQGYEYYMTALPLDSVKQVEKDGSYKMDKNGKIKVKTKYSKDIVNALIGHHNDYQQVGSILYEDKKYAEAAKCWGIYATLPYSGIADRDKFYAPDSVIAQIEFYQGVALWQSEDLKGAVEAFASARKHGNTAKEVYDYAMSCYANMNDNAGIIAVAKEALPIHGDKDSQYINILINDNINNEKYDEAQAMIEEALAKNPNSAELHNVMGVMYEQKKDEKKALEYYRKAVELDPNYAQGQFNVGRMIMKEAVEVQKELESLKGQEYTSAIETRLKPLYKEALPYMEKAWELDSTNSNARNLLRNIYYQLGDEDKLNALEQGY